MRLPGRCQVPAGWSAVLLGLGGSVLLTGGCAMSHDVINPIGMPTSQVTAPPVSAAGPTPAMQATPRQQAYLAALGAAGVHPSGDLFALTVGSYVCQAHTAGQSPQAVWDYVSPMVRADVRDGRPGAAGFGPATLPPGDVDATTADYIRIATAQLC